MQLLESMVQDYSWGSLTAIPALRGVEPDGRPQAELWMGAHPVAPSKVMQEGAPLGLDRLIAGSPGAMLGSEVSDRFDARLPFLLKVLAAAEPLSLQAHPSLSQAAIGFAREDKAGIPRGAPNRCFRDANHKPELLCALTPFEMLCGFRPLQETLELLRFLDVGGLAPHIRALEENGENAIPGLLRELLTKSDPQLVDAVVRACRAEGDGPGEGSRRWAARLGDAYPGDAGAVISLLLNYRVLTPGEAVFLGAGNLHAYLKGVGVEIMANSDNVLRGGLTPKHIDVDTLLEVLDPSPITPHVQVPTGAVCAYVSPVAEFRLLRVALGADSDGADVAHPTATAVDLVSAGPAIVLAVDGALRCTSLSGGAQVQLQSGSAMFLPASDSPIRMSGVGLGFVAVAGDPVETSLTPRE